MGWLADRRRKKEQNAYEAAFASWQEDHDELEGLIELASHPEGFTEGLEEVPILLKHGEAPFAVFSPSQLVESRRGPGHYAGGSQGFSFRIAKGLNYRVGANKGTFVQGDEQLTMIDTGSITVTSTRIVFQGSKQSREWLFSKVLGVQHDTKLPLTMVSVSNRQKVSGFTYDAAHTATVRLRVSMALAVSTGGEADLLADLNDQMAELNASRPVPPGTSPAAALPTPAARPEVSSTEPPPAAPAGWYPHPSNPAELRWWDGREWTDKVHTA